jgi:hypothetical protein
VIVVAVVLFSPPVQAPGPNDPPWNGPVTPPPQPIIVEWWFAKIFFRKIIADQLEIIGLKEKIEKDNEKLKSLTAMAKAFNKDDTGVNLILNLIDQLENTINAEEKQIEALEKEIKELSKYFVDALMDAMRQEISHIK